VTVATLLAPFTPFLAEVLWRNLTNGQADQPESVHLADYPTPADEQIDDALEGAMAVARAITVLGRTVRVETKTRVRQPLVEAVVHYSGDHAALSPLLDLVAEELNVKEIVFAESAGEFGRWHAKPDYRILGPRLGPAVKDVAQMLAGDDGMLAAALARGESVVLSVSGGQIELQPGDVDLTQEVRQGWGVASEGGLTVALDLELTPELRKEGLARELVRVVQDARKAAGLDVSDRIELGIETSGEIAEALAVHRDLVAGETLAITIGGDLSDGFHQDADIDGDPVIITVRKSTTNAEARPH
jgi:isoleucyl-tRNA synthetase